jgi:phospholipid transport system substrate-binding protein
MIIKRNIVAGFLILLLSVFIFPESSVADEKADSARDFIEGIADKALTTLTLKTLPREERVRQARSLLNKNFAIKRIGRWVLGPYWRKATKPERVEYLELFGTVVANTYVGLLETHPNVKLHIIKVLTIGKRDIVVFSRLDRPNKDSLKLDWRIQTMRGNFKILDVMVEGISMGQTQRSQYASAIRQNGGKVEALLKIMRKKVEQGGPTSEQANPVPSLAKKKT